MHRQTKRTIDAVSYGAFELLIGVLAIVSAVVFFLDPHGTSASSTVGMALPFAAVFAWNVGYGLAGLCLFFGVLAKSARVEAAGCSLLAGSVGVQLVTLYSVFGTVAIPTFVVFLATIAASLLRIRVLFSARSVLHL